MTDPAAVLDDLDAATETDLADLAALVAIESVSAEPRRAGAVRAAAEWLASYAEAAGLAARIHETPGRPIVIAAWTGAGPSAPTVLVYAHFDVQPVEPLDAWQSPPFEATVRDGRMYGRGVSDDKGQLLMHLSVARSYLRVAGALPVNVVYLLEGEEEQASPHLDAFVDAERVALRADVAVVTDGSMYAPDTPSVGYGVRGIVYLETRVRALRADLHSGIYGGTVPNAAHALAAIVASLHDADGRVAVPGFYDAVRPIGDDERARLGALPFDETAFRAAAGAEALSGETGFSTLERVWARPTLELNGLAAGHVGDGMKTIVPAVATARLSARLVPDQDPEAIARAIASHVRAVAPAGVTVEVEVRNTAPPATVPLSHPAVGAAAAALESAYGRPAVFQRHGGTVPAVSSIARTLGIPTVIVGFGLPEANAHAPNEWLSLDGFRRGRAAIAVMWSLFAELDRADPAGR